jgi:molecular chaperone HtpG
VTATTLPFKAELKQLLHLIVHSLYSHKDIFLRELISNASDAIDTLRFQSLTQPELLEGDAEWKIRLRPDPEKGTLTIADNGIGMSATEIVENLGTIAHSGTRAFLEALQRADARERPGLIGQFGVGFYSAFMVADRVTVLSRRAGPGQQGVCWESEGQGEFRVAPADKPTRGTEVILHLRPEDRDFLQPARLRQIVKQYSDFIEHPIVLEQDGREEVLNARKALWLRSRKEVTEEEYHQFYRHLSHDTEDPLKVIHYAAEGVLEFRALLYLPRQRTWDLVWGHSRKGMQLYVQRVLILDDWQALLPPYLRFVKGVVESPDLPLNVSREILQQSAPLEKIRNNLTNKILSTLEEMKRTEPVHYQTFFRELGSILKEGLIQDNERREQLAELLLFESTHTRPGEWTSLADYVSRMPAEQPAIYYLTGENRGLLEASPYVEALRTCGREVLLLTDPVDAFLVQALPRYRDKPLQAVDRSDLAGLETPTERQQEFAPLLDFLKEKIPEVREVRLSGRLRESAACLVTAAGEAGAHLERLLQRLGQDKSLPPSRRILEVNPDHPVLQALRQRHQQNPQDPQLETYARLLYEQAVLAEGSPLADLAGFLRRLNELLARDARHTPAPPAAA